MSALIPGYLPRLLLLNWPPFDLMSKEVSYEDSFIDYLCWAAWSLSKKQKHSIGQTLAHLSLMFVHEHLKC